MKLFIGTYYQDRSWFATCRLSTDPAAIGSAGRKRSEPAAISGAIGDLFKRLDGYRGYDNFPEEFDRELSLVIEIEQRGDKYMGRCFEQSFPELRGYSGPRTTQLAAAKRALGTYFHVRSNKKKEGAHARA